MLQAAVDFFHKLRKLGLMKVPATAELIDWLKVMRLQQADPNQGLKRNMVARTWSTLVKTGPDRERAATLLDELQD